ncbi:MAG: hypothetical protein LC789_13445 [Actinobacteria bacterium]|nr:hypothetical protein [Actinomycetota bacterium]MCA1721171.1 hypothetical protein [Actinomycetota bacterium]
MHAAESEAAGPRPWSVSMQVLVWTTVTVDADDLEQAMQRAEDHARSMYGDEVFINRDATEVA